MPPPTRDPAWRRWLLPALGFAAILLLWQLWVSARHVEHYVLPTPVRIGEAARHDLGTLWPDVVATLTIAIEGLVIGAVAAVLIAVLVVRVRLARQVLMPIFVISQTIPMIVLAPLFVIWWGYGVTPKIVLVTLITVFPVLVSTVAGMDGADEGMVDLVRSMGASPRGVMRTVRLPAALPGFFAGLRIAATYAIGGAVIAEYLGSGESRHGLGFRIIEAKQGYEIDRIFVAVALVGVLTALLFALVELASRLAMPWTHLDRPAGRRRPIRPSAPSSPEVPA
jgi:ABC-type nitrate/sulfonate/bicarbonate transport system permease component